MIEQKARPDTLSQLVGALLLQLADDVPDSAGLETVRADLLAASRDYEAGTKQDLALRFYLATRTLLQAVSHQRSKETAKVLETAASAGAHVVVETTDTAHED